jgi:amidase
MARSVADAAMLLGALAGTDPGDPATAEADARRARDYASGLEGNALKGARLGWVRTLMGQHPKVDRVMAEARRVLEGRGAVLVDVELSSAPYDGAELEVLLFEFKAGLEAYQAGRGGTLRTLADLAAFDEAHAAAEMPLFGQELVLQAQAKGPLTDPAYLKALEACGRARKDILALLDQHRLDALAGPTGAPVWLIDPVNGDAPGFSFSSPAAVGGCPHLTVPAGLAGGLPVGLSFVGRPWSEAALLGLGSAFEQGARARRAPRYLSTATG